MRILHSADFIHMSYSFHDKSIGCLSISLIINVVNYLCIFSPSLAQTIASILHIQNRTKVLLQIRKFLRITQRKSNIILNDVLRCKLFK